MCGVRACACCAHVCHGEGTMGVICIFFLQGSTMLSVEVSLTSPYLRESSTEWSRV